ncbi:MAG: family 16 glycoside hydrolase [Saprospiraceae bacterium]
MKFNFKLFSITLILLFITTAIFAQDDQKLEGRWDLVISKDGRQLPSWLEVRLSGNRTLIGRFVYAFGSARPVSHIKVKDGEFSFAIPPQWEAGERNMEFEGKLVGEKLTGTMKYTDGKIYNWTANRAPKLLSIENPVWGAPREIFNQKNLDGWYASRENQWVVENGILTSKKAGANLISDEKFSDFKLHIEFRYPKESNSGVYLRGRYEVQIADNKGSEPSDIMFGGVYGFLTPNEMVAKSAGEWQAFDITLIGRRVTVVANGKTIISDQIIPGITGDALDSREGESGSFMLQGDHGPIEYRNIVVTPLMKK